MAKRTLGPDLDWMGDINARAAKRTPSSESADGLWSLVCVAFLTSSADELGTQRSLADCRVDFHLGARNVLVHPRISALLRFNTVGGRMRVADDSTAHCV